MLFLLCCCGGGAYAAAPPTRARALKLEDAVRAAERTSEAVTVARAAVDRADAQWLQAFSEWLPQLNGSLTYDRTLATEFDVLFSALPPDTAGGSPLTRLPFGRENTWRAGLSFSQNLFAGWRTTARLRMARAAKRAALLGLGSARAAVLLEVVQAYYDAVLAQRLLDISRAALSQAEDTLRLVRLGAEQGARPEFDLLRAQVAAQNQRPQVLSAQLQLELAQLRLKQLLELPLEQPLELEASLDAPQLRDLSELTEGLPLESAESRAPVGQAQAAVDVRRAAVRVAWSQHLPTFNVVSSYGWVNYPEGLFPPGLDGWRNNWTVGVQLLVPIFSGLRVTGDVRSTRADLREARARARQTEEQVALDTRSAAQQLASARALWESSFGAVTQAERAYELAQLRYQEGISTQLELSDAQLLLQQARANRARSARDVLVAGLRVRLLPLLPVQPAGLPGGVGTGMTAGGTSLQLGTGIGAMGTPPLSQPSPSVPGAGGVQAAPSVPVTSGAPF